MFKRILVPLDGSELSERVFPWLQGLVKQPQDTRITLLRAFEPPSTVYLLPELSVPTSNAFSDKFLSGMLHEYLVERSTRLEGFTVDCKTTLGEAASEILSHSDNAELIVMASHGRGGLGKWLMGSVATKVVRGATVPVLVVGGRVLEETHKRIHAIKKILVPTDGSETSERAFKLACDLARGLGAELHLYTGVSQVEFAHQVALEANRAGVEHFQDYQSTLIGKVSELEIACTVKETHGKTEIAEFAEEVDADLIVMGSHGKGGLERWLVGSETEKTLQLARCPVMITH